MKRILLFTGLLVAIGNVSGQQIGDGFASRNDNFSNILYTGVYNGAGVTDGVPDGSHSFQHLFVMRHNNATNNYQFQLASTFSENDRLFFRKIAKDILLPRSTTWFELATRGSNNFVGNQYIDGKVGIGTPTPGARLHILDGGFRHGGTGEINIDAPGILGGRFKILDNGNVGIGSSNPSGLLHINNLKQYNLNMSPIGQDHILLTASDPGIGKFFGGMTWSCNGRRRASIAATRENEDADHVGIAFFTQGVDGEGDFFESMRINYSGNVGIGTTTPDYKLDVVGTIRAHEVKVSLDKTADFVFAPDYNLRSLKEVEAFVTDNKHLPEIASAKEMEENGLNMAEFQIQLLQKVEELTLYIIEQQKTMEAMQSEIQELKTK